MAAKHGPWWRNTWWGKQTTVVNVALVVALLLFLLWMAQTR